MKFPQFEKHSIPCDILKKKKQDGRERFSLSLFLGDKAFTEYDHETTLRCAEKLYHFGVMKLYARRVVLYLFFFLLYFSFLPF